MLIPILYDVFIICFELERCLIKNVAAMMVSIISMAYFPTTKISPVRN